MATGYKIVDVVIPGGTGGGGGEGTSNYNDLSNKPKINDVTLSGNKTLAQLGAIAEPAQDGTNGQVLTTDGNGGRSWTTVQGGGTTYTAGEGISIDNDEIGVDFNTVASITRVNELSGNVTELERAVGGKINAPSDAGTAGQVLTLDDDLNPVWDDVQGGGGTSDYDELSNKPSINSVTLSGNKTSSDLGLADKTVVATTQPAGGMLPDAVYNLGELSGTITFALAAAVSGNVNHYFWTFSTGATAPTVTWPNGITWQGGSAPTINASKHYEISILNNYGIALEV